MPLSKLTKQQLIDWNKALIKYVQNYTAHKPECPCYIAATGNGSKMPDCSCGYTDAIKELLVMEKSLGLAG